MTAAVVALHPCGFCKGPMPEAWSWRCLDRKLFCGACAEGERARRGYIDARIDAAKIPDGFRFIDGDFSTRVKTPDKVLDAIVGWAAQLISDGRNLVLEGAGTGIGKTTAAVVALERGVEEYDGQESARFVAAEELALARRNARLGREAPLVQKAAKVRLLVLDDLPAPEDGGEIEYVIRARYNAGLTTIFTTWATREQMIERYHAPVARRIYEHAIVITPGARR